LTPWLLRLHQQAVGHRGSARFRGMPHSIVDMRDTGLRREAFAVAQGDAQ
jgi:hypothetical protein